MIPGIPHRFGLSFSCTFECNAMMSIEKVGSGPLLKAQVVSGVNSSRVILHTAPSRVIHIHSTTPTHFAMGQGVNFSSPLLLEIKAPSPLHS